MIFFRNLCLLSLLVSCTLILADPIVTFFFRKYPQAELANSTMRTLSKPHGIAKRTLEGVLHHNPISGIFSTYFGFINSSDENGQTMFPRKQSSTKLHLVITNKITPIMMFKNTVSHWELVPGTPAVSYLLEQKEDPETKLIFWQAQKEELPDDNKISSEDSLIIIAKPKNVYVPTGITLSQSDANLILPQLYAKKSIQTNRNALYMLNLAFLFRPIDLLYKKDKLYYETLVAE